MAYGFVQDVPANEEMYGEIRARLGEQRPDGLVAHVALRREQGLRYVDVWDSREQWERFREDRLEPAVDAVLASYGLPHDHSLVTITEFDVVDAWLGEPAAV
jgi:hypothetical protein